MSSLSVFLFDSQEVRVIIVDSEPWLVAADVCLSIDIPNVSQALTRLDCDEKRDDIITNDVIGRGQATWYINESGLYSLILTSRKPGAKKFKKWVTSEVLPAIRKTGQYSAKPQTMGEIILAQAQLLVDVERRTATLESDVAVIKDRAVTAEKELKALPPASKNSPCRTTRNNINTLVRAFCHAVGMGHKEAWNNLYREFRDRCHVDLKIRASNGNCKPLDLAETLDVLEDLYAVAQDIFKV